MSNDGIAGNNTHKSMLKSDMFSGSDLRNSGSVDIIIPFHGNYNGVIKLIEGVMSSVTTVRYHITLVDDCSPNEGFSKQISSKSVRGLSCRRLDKKSGFAAAVNFAIRNPVHAWIPHVCIMHSDVLPADAMWLGNLGSTLRRMRSSNVKMVGARSSNFGSEMSHLNTEKNSKVEDRILEASDFLPLFCSMAHRQLFSSAGYLDENLTGAELCRDFAVRMKSKGFHQAVAASCWVAHGAKSPPPRSSK